ncbi:hypothetical protein CYLTODRAFT_490795 [Cylindrobasidium torrendii FP15055 ss-10]|uniref:MYND-type domain-containing protein n=1 Tax=Cylindrobasidium torrendii FP15055 ss-10 TaxID=1314674 RepID=A0A0D7B9K8_9AGAR|nr:hypothetical protein CYLTODRAFT_490795 [Cylindrobasidium torrendii FP15055 ss-10]
MPPRPFANSWIPGLADRYAKALYHDDVEELGLFVDGRQAGQLQSQTEELRNLIPPYLTLERLGYIRVALGLEQGEYDRQRAAHILRGAKLALMMFALTHSVEPLHRRRGIEDVTVDVDIPSKILPWLFLAFSRPSPLFDLETLGIAAMALQSLLSHQLYRNTFNHTSRSLLPDVVASWLVIVERDTEDIEVENPSSVVNISKVEAFHGLVVRILEQDALGSTFSKVLESRSRDVAGALVGSLVRRGFTDVGNRTKLIEDNWFIYLHVAQVTSQWPMLRASMLDRDIIGVTCRILRRFARRELVSKDTTIWGELLSETFRLFIPFFRGPPAVKAALQGSCLLTVLRIHSAYAIAHSQSASFTTPPDSIDSHVFRIMSTIRGYAKIPSFHHIISKSLQQVEQKRAARNEPLRLSGKVAEEYDAIRQALEKYSTVLPLLEIRTQCAASNCSKPIFKIGLKCCGFCKMLMYCSSSCQRHDWTEGEHRIHCPRLRASQIQLAPHCPLKYTDMAIVSSSYIDNLHRAIALWQEKKVFGTDTDLAVVDLGRGIWPGHIDRIFDQPEYASDDMQPWRELIDRRAPARGAKASPYVLFMVASWPLDLTNMDALVAGQVKVQSFAC